MKAFFKFESLVDCNADYKCVLCGIHPVILNFDVMRKCAFKLHGIVNNTNQDLEEEVDHDLFWQQVNKVCIDHNINENSFAPTLSFWPLWMARKTRRSNMVFSTEFQKGHKESEEVEYLKCLSEETLEDLFNMGNVTMLRELCAECGIKAGNMTKIDCISRLKSAVQSVTNIDKLFFKVWQASGGLLTCTCVHGIVYAFKCLLKAESPRDYGDILLSMKHPPNVVISDIPHMLAAHVNKRCTDFFNPYAGRVATPSVENIKAVAEGYFQQVSIPWLHRIGGKSVDGVNVENTKIHPITLVQQRFSLFDKFHEKNSKQPKEKLRRTSLVTELDGVCTESEEQLNSFVKKNIYFLDGLSPIHHVQMIKTILALRNKMKNQKVITKLQNLGYTNFEDDEYGRIRIVNTEMSKLETCDDIKIPGSQTACDDKSVNATEIVKPFSSTSVISDQELSTPGNAPFSLGHDDLQCLLPGKYILGQVIDAIFVILSSRVLNETGNKVFILPENFFSRINSDISLEATIPNDLSDVQFIVGASYYSHHWALVLIDCLEKRILFLDPIKTKYMPIEKVNADMAVVRNIIWHSILRNAIDIPVPSKLRGWKQLLDHESFRQTYHQILPSQDGNPECGSFVLIYFYYIASCRPFDFTAEDMPLIRNWFLNLLTSEHTYADCSTYLIWFILKMPCNKLGSLQLRDVPKNEIQRIHEVVDWLISNQDMFSRLPQYPTILNRSYEEQMEIIRKLDDDVMDEEMDVMEEESERQRLMEMKSFCFFNREDFSIFLKIVNKLDWNICMGLEAET